MKAVVLHEYGGPEQLRYEDVDVPKCGDDQVLVRMQATSVNPIDYKLRSGAAKAHFPLKLPAILGRDLAGEVVELGKNVTGFSKGMRVMGVSNATYAEFVAADAKALTAIPDGLKPDRAAALPLVVTTGAQLVERGISPTAGHTVLVTGALGGVGRTALHVVRRHGARALAGVRSNEKEMASKLRADGVIAIDSDDEIGRLHDLDAIADAVDGATIQKLLKCIRKGGDLASVLGIPEEAKKYDMRAQAIVAQPDATRLHELAEDFAADKFTIPIARVMKLEDVQEAHRLAEGGGVGGKIVLIPG